MTDNAPDFVPDDPSDMDPQSAVASQGLRQGAQALYNSTPVQNAVTGKGLSDYYNTAVSAAQGNEGARDEVAQRSLGTAMGSIKTPELAMDEASRLARAEKMGFDTSQTYYHGTNSDIEYFDPAFKGKNTQAQSAKKGFFFTESPHNASDYAQNAVPSENIHANMEADNLLDQLAEEHPIINDYKQDAYGEPLNIADEYSGSIQRFLDDIGISDEISPEWQKEIDAYEHATFNPTTTSAGPNVLPVHLKSQNPYIHDFKGSPYRETTYNDIIKKAKKLGHDSVLLKNTYDPGAGNATLMAEQGHPPENIMVVFKPEQIRSKFAEFDPKKSKSSNLSYASGGSVPSPDTLNALQYYDAGGGVSQSATQNDTPDFIPDDQFQPDAPSQSDNAPDFIPDSEFQSDEAQYSTPGQQVLAGLEGASQGLAGPVAPALELASGLTTPEAMRGREQNNPGTFGAAKGLTFLGSALMGTGEAALLGRAGEAVAQAAGLTGATYGAKIAAGALRGATEMGLLSAGDEATRAIIQDPTTSAQTALTDIGLNGALGVVAGGALGGIGKLLSGVVGTQAVQEIENFKGQLAARAEETEPAQAVHDEMSAWHNEMRGAYDETYGLSGTKARAIAKAVPQEMTDDIAQQANDVSDQLANTVAKMRKEPYSYPERFVSKLEADANHFRETLTPTDGSVVSPLDVFNATQDLKQMAQGYARYGDVIKPTDEAYDFVHAMRPLGTSLKSALENPDVWGDAGKLQSGINNAFTKFKPSLEAIENVFGEKVPNPETGQMQTQMSAPKFKKFVNQAGTLKDVTKRTILQSALKQGEQFQAALENAYSSIGEQSPFTHSPMNSTRRALQELTPGMKLANAAVDQGIGQGAARGLAGAVGAPFGGWGVLASEIALGPYFEKALPVIGKAFFEKAGSVPGLKSAGEFVNSALKGQRYVTQAARNVFKSGAEVLPASLIPSLTQLHKLNTALASVQTHPQVFAQNLQNTHLGTYLPDHAQAMSQTLANAVQYVNNQRPNSEPKAPLDARRAPSDVKQGAFHSLLTIAQQPLTIMAKVKAGTVTPDEVKHINSMYPAGWQQMQSELAQAMTSHISKGASVPYKTRIGMSIATGQAMDSTFTPASILAAQPGGGQPQAPAAQAPKQRAKSSTKNLHTIADQSLTPLQARMKREAGSEE